jgi:hypothetical protein
MANDLLPMNRVVLESISDGVVSWNKLQATLMWQRNAIQHLSQSLCYDGVS